MIYYNKNKFLFARVTIPPAGIEPAQLYSWEILSLLRLPIPPWWHEYNAIYDVRSLYTHLIAL